MFGPAKLNTYEVEFVAGPADGLRLYVATDSLPDVLLLPHLQYPGKGNYLPAQAQAGYHVDYWCRYRSRGYLPQCEYYWCKRIDNVIFYRFLRYYPKHKPK